MAELKSQFPAVEVSPPRRGEVVETGTPCLQGVWVATRLLQASLGSESAERHLPDFIGLLVRPFNSGTYVTYKTDELI